MNIKQDTKYFVLDTNILLTDPSAIYGFGDNVVVITGTVLQELDIKKKISNDLGFNARETIRVIDELRLKGNLIDGVELQNGGYLLVEPNGVSSERLPNGYDIDKPDNRIISSCI